MKARIKFMKTGTMKFVGHLDLMRYFQKAFRRAEIDIAYSKGYGHHPIMSFAQPLGIGLTSEGEYLDVELNSSGQEDEMINKINCQLNEELQVLGFRFLLDDARNAMSIVSAADYQAVLKDGYAMMPDFQQNFERFLTQDTIMIEKKTKKGSAVVDIKPFLYEYAFSFESFMDKTARDSSNIESLDAAASQTVYLRMAAGSVVNIKPEQVFNAFYQECGLEYVPFSYQYHRLDLLADFRGEGEKQVLVSLGEIMR